MRRIKIILASGFWLLAFSLFAQVNSDSLISVYSKKIQKYLDKDSTASKYFSFTKEGIEVYQPATDTSERRFQLGFSWQSLPYIRYTLSRSETQEFLKLHSGRLDLIRSSERINLEITKRDSAMDKVKLIRDEANQSIATRKLLSGYKIALDPGHLAGDLETAKMEKKWVEMKPNVMRGIKEPIQLIEGELTLTTAKILKKKLEAQGATVMLTRDQPNVSSFGVDFKKWKDSLFVRQLDSAYARGDVSFEEKNFLSTKANETEIFRRFFIMEDIYERARKINAFCPDLTLIIHYNVDETNQNWNRPTKKNFNMAFVGGGFAGDELDKPEARIDFLRLLLTDDLEHSIEFSEFMVKSLVEKTGVPAALDSCAIYLKGNCLNTGAEGVFCRNLALTRKVKGTICYGESLYQDNISECKALSKKDASAPLSVTNGVQTSQRVEEVAEAYYQGIMNYVKSKGK